MTLPCVCELTAGGQKPPATAPATVRVDQQRRTQDRASSELPKGAPGPLRSQRRRSGQDGHPARCTGQLRPLAQTKTSQQIEHTRTSDLCGRRRLRSTGVQLRTVSARGNRLAHGPTATCSPTDLPPLVPCAAASVPCAAASEVLRIAQNDGFSMGGR